MSGATPDSDAAPAASFTIDEVVEQTGVPKRRIRFYQTNGVLPPPDRRGRVAYYGSHHIERLRLVGELQDRGLRLAAIRDLVTDDEPSDPVVREWLGFEDTAGGWVDDDPQVMADGELAARLEGHPPGTKAALQDVGLIAAQGEGLRKPWLVPSPTLLEVALDLLAAGIDLETSAEAGQLMAKRLGRLADELVKHFFSNLDDGAIGPGEAADILQALRPASDRALRVIYGREIERAIRENVERAARERAKGGRRDGRTKTDRRKKR